MRSPARTVPVTLQHHHQGPWIDEVWQMAVMDSAKHGHLVFQAGAFSREVHSACCSDSHFAPSLSYPPLSPGGSQIWRTAASFRPSWLRRAATARAPLQHGGSRPTFPQTTRPKPCSSVASRTVATACRRRCGKSCTFALNVTTATCTTSSACRGVVCGVCYRCCCPRVSLPA